MASLSEDDILHNFNKTNFMLKSLTLFAIITTALACDNLNSKTSSDQKGAAVISQTTGPDASDLLKTLQGRWQSEQDSTYVLEISDTQMRHFNRGKLSLETDLEIDGSCSTTPCKIDSTDLSDGWCFVEKSNNDVQCNIIITCDKEYLKYKAIGAANGLLVFKKL
jgi:hypothetical protein